VLFLEALDKEIIFKKKLFVECPVGRHSAKKLIFFKKKLFAECRRYSAKLGNLLGHMVTLSSVISLALGKVTRTDLFIRL
jgi:hypothetical protein